jgi:hypothetical protein
MTIVERVSLKYDDYRGCSIGLEERLYRTVIIMTGLMATRAVMGYPLRFPARPVAEESVPHPCSTTEDTPLLPVTMGSSTFVIIIR